MSDTICPECGYVFKCDQYMEYCTCKKSFVDIISGTDLVRHGGLIATAQIKEHEEIEEVGEKVSFEEACKTAAEDLEKMNREHAEYAKKEAERLGCFCDTEELLKDIRALEFCLGEELGDLEPLYQSPIFEIPGSHNARIIMVEWSREDFSVHIQVFPPDRKSYILGGHYYNNKLDAYDSYMKRVDRRLPDDKTK